MTLVSVVLPTYNGEQFLVQSIESVLNQTYKNLELIIVNDCSTDSTLQIALKYAEIDNRIKVITNAINSKLPQSLNNGFAQAKGDYLTWTSDDNYFQPNAIEKMLDYLDNHKEDVMVCCDFEIIEADGSPREIRRLKINSTEMITSNPCGACFLYRQSAAKQVGEYNTNKFLVEDYDYWLRLGLVGKIGHIAELLYVYRFHPKSLTATRMTEILKRTSFEIRELLPLYLEKYPEIKNTPEIKKLEQKLDLEDVLETGDKQKFKKIKKVYSASKLYKILKDEYKQTQKEFLLKLISKLGILYKFKAKSLALKSRKEKNKVSSIKQFGMAIDWINKFSVNNNGIVVNSTQPSTIYPEVSGYYIPTLIKWGDKNRAKAYADYLLSIQNDDGSWNDPSGATAYTFDTGQILKGLWKFIDEAEKYKSAFLKGCDWILTQQIENGSIATPDTSYWELPNGKFVPEAIHLYCLEPLQKVAKKFGIDKYEDCVKKALNFYLADEKLTDFETLSHFNAYVIEALIDLGQIDRAKKAMANIAKYQRKDGSVPAYANVDFVCSTGLFQYAICWYKLGDVQRGDKAFKYASNLQNKTGGWYGSYGKKANYFPDAEISWAVKYFLDALYYKNIGIKKELIIDEDILNPNFSAEEKEKNVYEFFKKNYAFFTDFPNYFYLRYNEFKVLKQLLPQYFDENKKYKKTLEIGCGFGFNSVLLSRYTQELLGYDIPEKYAGYVKGDFDTSTDVAKYIINDKLGYNNIVFDVSYPDNINNIKDNDLDLIFSQYVLEHIPDLDAAIKEMYRMLKKHGLMIHIVPTTKDAITQYILHQLNNSSQELKPHSEYLSKFSEQFEVYNLENYLFRMLEAGFEVENIIQTREHSNILVLKKG